MEGGRVKTHHSGEQMGEEPGNFAQERALALDAPQLLKECEGVMISESESSLRGS
jgi:hypothetical protein